MNRYSFEKIGIWGNDAFNNKEGNHSVKLLAVSFQVSKSHDSFRIYYDSDA